MSGFFTVHPVDAINTSKWAEVKGERLTSRGKRMFKVRKLHERGRASPTTYALRRTHVEDEMLTKTWDEPEERDTSTTEERTPRTTRTVGWTNA